MTEMSQFEKNARKRTEDMVALLVRKNRDYGTENIEMTGIQGIGVRLQDKVSRLRNLTDDPTRAISVQDESIMDTLIDIMGYGLIGQMLLAGEFKQDDGVYFVGSDENQRADGSWSPWVYGPQPSQHEPDSSWVDGYAEGHAEGYRTGKRNPGFVETLLAGFTKLQEVMEEADRIDAERREDEAPSAYPDGQADGEPQSPAIPAQTGLVYLAGPIDAVSPDESRKWRNFVQDVLAERGIATFNPATAVTNGNAARQPVSNVCRSVIACCDYVIAYLPTGWPAFGSIIELEIARSLEVPVVVVSDWVGGSVFSSGFHVVRFFEDAMDAVTCGLVGPEALDEVDQFAGVAD